MDIEEIENDMILAEKIMRIQEHITETIKEHGDISQFKEDVLYVIHFLLEKNLTPKQLTATQIQAKQMEYAVYKEKTKKDEKYIRLLKCELDKKDKIINEMIQEYEYSARINVKDFCDEEIRKDKCIQDCTNCIKEYFTKKAREGE